MVSNNVILIGFMGVGKTSLGKKIARNLDLEFIDTDEIIEKQQGKTIAQIFEEEGEEYFRRLEFDLIQSYKREKTAKAKPKVISVGGGLPVYNNLMKDLNQLGTTLYLQRPAKELFNRLVNAKDKRPLVMRLNEEELLSYIEETLLNREAFYNQAKFIVDRNHQEVKTILDLLKQS